MFQAQTMAYPSSLSRDSFSYTTPWKLANNCPLSKTKIANTHMHVCMHIRTHTHTYTHTHIHARTHTHTHTHAEERFFLFIFYGRETLLLLLRSKRCSSEPVLLNDASFPGSANIAQRLQKLREREGDRQRERKRNRQTERESKTGITKHTNLLTPDNYSTRHP